MVDAGHISWRGSHDVIASIGEVGGLSGGSGWMDGCMRQDGFLFLCIMTPFEPEGCVFLGLWHVNVYR